MKLAARLAFVWLVACSGRDLPARMQAPASPSPVAARAVTAPAAPAPLTAPHGGPIDLLAVTDAGDAVLTADAFADLRLWPVLDGLHEPVVVRGPKPVQLALGRDRDGLFSAILDEAGGVELQRFDALGRSRGRAQLPAQPPIEQVVAIPGGVLVRRQDHHIARFDVRGVAMGELVPAAGRRVVSLAVRRDRALAGLSEADEPRARIVQWIALGDALAWGAAAELPEPLAELAISPGGGRLAGLAQDDARKDEVGKIVELASRPAVIATIALAPRRRRMPKGGRPLRLDPPVIGFARDDDVVMGAPGQLIWASATTPTPWRAEPASRYVSEGEIAVGDHVAIARSTTLQLSDHSLDSFLGYRYLGDGLPATEQRFREGGGVLLEVEGYGKLWLDPHLGARPPTLDPELRDLELVLDERHLLFSPLVYDRVHPVSHRIFVRDLQTNTDTDVAAIADVSSVRYDPGTRVLAVAAGDRILRYRLAFDPVAATELRTLAHTGTLPRLHLTDPALANGVVAVVEGQAARPQALVYRLDGDDRGGPVSPHQVALAGPVTAVDRAGAIYVAAAGVKVHRDGRPVASLALGAVTAVNAVSHDGQLLAASYANEVTVADAAGGVRWHHPVWHAGPVAWSADDRTLFVVADGGAALSFDATTGERLALRCGWGFGLYLDDVTASSNMPSACAAP